MMNNNENTLSSTSPLVSIVSINYNQSKVSCELLESLKKISYPNVEVIMVDNDSLKDDPSTIPRQHPWVKFIKNQTNLGFAGGNNVGIKEAKGEYILLLNNDTEVEEGFLEPLVNKLMNEPSAAAAGPKIRFHHTPDTIQFAGYTPLNMITLRNHLIGFRKKDSGQYDTPVLTPFVHGAAMLVKRKVIEEIGLMPDIYFLYYEELDWCFQMSKAGYNFWYVPQSLVFHKESISTGKLSPLKTYFLTRNRILFLRRNTKGIKYITGLFYQVFVAWPKNFLSHLFHFRWKHIVSLRKALGWHISHIFDKDIHSNPNL